MAIGNPDAVDLSRLDPEEQLRRNALGMRAAVSPVIAPPSISQGLNLPPVGPQPFVGAVPGDPTPKPTIPAYTPAVATHRLTALDRDQSELSRLRSTGSGISQLKPQSTIGKVGKDLLGGLDVVGSIAAPGFMARVPGTSLHHAILESRAAGNLAQDSAQEQKQAQTEEERAQARKTQAEADAGPGAAATVTTADGIYQWNPDSGRYDIRIGPAPAKTAQTAGEQTLHDLMTGDNGQPRINPATRKPYTYLEAYNAVQKPSGNFEEQAYQEWKATHPDGTREEFARQHAADVRTPREGSWIPMEDGQGNPVLYNPVTRQTQSLPAGFKAKGAGHVDTATKEKVLTYWQPALDSAERFNVMARNYQDALQDHDQQAMLSLLANHLGMTMGLQKGSRLTRDIIHEAEQSRPWLQGLQAKFDKNGYLTGVVLTPQQMAQMMTLAEGRYSQDVAKSRSMAGYVGVTDEPERKLSPEGAAYYLSISNGDKDKARGAARADGWQF